MQINSVSMNSRQHSYNTNFKQGLTQSRIERVKQLGFFDFETINEKIFNRYGIKAYSGCSKTVAYCAELTANIMSRTGFQLPKLFSFKPIPMNELGRYTGEDEVIINSGYDEFLDLEEQNRLCEGFGRGCIGSKHFLDTYLHEFSHAAHYKNILSKFGESSAYDIFWRKMEFLSPENLILSPIEKFLNKFFPAEAADIKNKVFGENECLMKSKNVSEYIADKNVSMLVSELGEDCVVGDLDSDLASVYDEDFEKTKNLNFDADKITDPEKFLKDCIKHFDGAIWNGDINEILLTHLSIAGMNSK